MKQLIKYFIFSLFIMLFLSACSLPTNEDPDNEIKGTISPDALDKLHYIHPTKPIKVPDTMTVTTIAPTTPNILYAPQDTTQR